jgi:hypothetical protein
MKQEIRALSWLCISYGVNEKVALQIVAEKWNGDVYNFVEAISELKTKRFDVMVREQQILNVFFGRSAINLAPFFELKHGSLWKGRYTDLLAEYLAVFKHIKKLDRMILLDATLISGGCVCVGLGIVYFISLFPKIKNLVF